MSNYPPGVTGNEYEIAGPDYEKDYDTPCPKCGDCMMELGYRGTRWVVCCACDYTADLPSIEKDWGI